MLNAVIAASSQVGDLARAFETFEAAGALGLAPDTDSYNAIMEGCVRHGQSGSLPKVESCQEQTIRRPTKLTPRL